MPVPTQHPKSTCRGRRIAASAAAAALSLPLVIGSAGAGAAAGASVTPRTSGRVSSLAGGLQPFHLPSGGSVQLAAAVRAERRAVARMAAVRLSPGVASSLRPAGRPDRPAQRPLPSASSSATTFTVNSTADDALASMTGTRCVATNNRCTLRAAVEAADNLGKPVVVKLASRTYTLTISEPLIDTDSAGITVEGVSDSQTTVTERSGLDVPIFGATLSTSNEFGGLWLSGLEVMGGSSTMGGGAVAIEDGNAVLTNVLLDHNDGGSAGGAIVVQDGRLWLTDSAVRDNSAATGGGIACVGCDLELTNSQVTNNVASGDGGGIFAQESDLSITGGSLSSNRVSTSGGAGGGLTGTEETLVSIVGTKIDHDKVAADGQGGAIATDGGTLSIADSTLDHDDAPDGGVGAAVLGVSVVATLSGDTVDDNGTGLGTVALYDNGASGGPSGLQLSRDTISHNSSGGVLVGDEDPTSAFDVNVSQTTIGHDTLVTDEDCAPGVCAAALAGSIDLSMSDDSVSDDSIGASSDSAGGMVVGAISTTTPASAAVTLERCTFDDDVSTGSSPGSSGGVAVLSEGDAPDDAPISLTVTGSTFEHDSAGAGGTGGGLGVLLASSSSSSVDVSAAGDTFADDSVGTKKVSGVGGGMVLGQGVAASVVSTTFSHDSSIGPGVDAGGGGLADVAGEPLTLSDDSFASNSTTGFGGGAAIVEAFASVSDSSFDDNVAEAGGGVFVEEAGFEISGSTFDANSLESSSAEPFGAALALDDSLGGIANTTITANDAGTKGSGGAVIVVDSALALDSDTVTANVARHGALFTSGAGESVSVKNSILTGNRTASRGGSESDCAHSGGSTPGEPATSIGGNVLGSSKCVSGLSPTDTVSKSPKLAALAKNGGPTETLALEKGSPALRRGQSCLSTDQRGVARPANDCDSGAYELTKA